MNDTETKENRGAAPKNGGGRHHLDECCVLDVRTPGEFGTAHIAGSINVPLPDVGDFARNLRDIAAGREVVIVCRTGQRAQKAREALESAGLEGLRVLEGGLVSWEGAGHPVRRGEAGMSLERQVRVAAGSLAVVGVALGYLVHPGFFGVAGFVGAGLVHAGITDTCAMGMILARMPWNRGAAVCERS